MSQEHKRPLYVFILVFVACTMMLASGLARGDVGEFLSRRAPMAAAPDPQRLPLSLQQSGDAAVRETVQSSGSVATSGTTATQASTKSTASGKKTSGDRRDNREGRADDLAEGVEEHPGKHLGHRKHGKGHESCTHGRHGKDDDRSGTPTSRSAFGKSRGDHGRGDRDDHGDRDDRDDRDRSDRDDRDEHPSSQARRGHHGKARGHARGHGKRHAKGHGGRHGKHGKGHGRR